MLFTHFHAILLTISWLFISIAARIALSSYPQNITAICDKTAQVVFSTLLNTENNDVFSVFSVQSYILYPRKLLV